MSPSPPPLRAIPSVEKLLQALGPLDVPRPTATAVVRRELAALRAQAATAQTPPFEEILQRVRKALQQLQASRLLPVINATGIPLHTNLGRAPLAPAAVEALVAVAANYNNLEYDLTTGARGSRAAYLEHNLALATGAEAATIVNNCAAALVLILRHFTRGSKKEVVISRGELVQIGGGFRVPEIMEASGARLREVGTTNQTSLEDYAAVITKETALLLTVHRSNFYQGGFTDSPAISALAALARKQRIPLAEDLGSGALVETGRLAPPATALGHERTPMEAIRDGVDVVCFSGDKLLGGPQAGIIAGRARRIAALKREPFYRALRCDKLALTALEVTVDLYLSGRQSEIPTLAMLQINAADLHARAENILRALAGLPLSARIGAAVSRVGGGTMPKAELASVSIDLQPTNGMTVDELAARLRGALTPIVGYISSHRCRLDLRTVFPAQDALIIQALHAIFTDA